jgi:chromosome segregation ATPase
MNAVMRKREMAQGTDMPANENDSLGIQVAELRADVRHIQSDVTDIKADLRITNHRIESLETKTDGRFEKVEQKIETLRKETGDRFEKADQKLETFRKETGDRFEKVMYTINELRDSLASAKIWALGLYVALAGSLFYVLARGFKWL